jgi:hypothetical protein
MGKKLNAGARNKKEAGKRIWRIFFTVTSSRLLPSFGIPLIEVVYIPPLLLISLPALLYL